MKLVKKKTEAGEDVTILAAVSRLSVRCSPDWAEVRETSYSSTFLISSSQGEHPRGRIIARPSSARQGRAKIRLCGGDSDCAEERTGEKFVLTGLRSDRRTDGGKRGGLITENIVRRGYAVR